jgi:hypothetical protein
MVQNKITKFPSVFLLYEMDWNGIWSIFIFCRMVQNEITKFRVSKMAWYGIDGAFLSSAEWFRTKLRSSECPKWLVTELTGALLSSAEWFRTKLQSSECQKMVWYGIPSIFHSANQAEFRRNESKFLSVLWKIFSLQTQ